MAAVLGVGALSIAVTGTGLAADSTAAAPGPVHACVTTTGGAIRIVTATAVCRTGETSLTWRHVGPTGPAGAVGAVGATGPAGPAGATGAKGARGATGAKGAMGATGDTGASGQPGAVGATGPQGDPGVQGMPGAVGATGDTGPQGAPGATGDVGATGAQGVPGDTGAQGVPGDTGAQGVPGDTGPQGVPGDIGPQGDTGAAGPKGDTGATGPAGPQGVAGTNGTDATVTKIAFLGGRACCSSDQTVTAGTSTNVAFTQGAYGAYSIGGGFNFGTGAFTAPVSGVYDIQTDLTIRGTAGASYQFFIRTFNGDVTQELGNFPSAGAAHINMSATVNTLVNGSLFYVTALSANSMTIDSYRSSFSGHIDFVS